MTLPNDYFLDVEDELLEYLEKQANSLTDDLLNARQRQQDKALTLFNLLATGCGGAFLIWATNDLAHYISIALMVVSAFWGLSAIYLLLSVLRLTSRESRGNRPQNIYQPCYKSFTSDEKMSRLGLIRRYELINQEQRISALLASNQQLARHVNRVMIFSTLTPLFGLLIA